MDRNKEKPSAARTRIEYGDFQTPHELASRIVRLLKRSRAQPKSIIEPTCGQGSLLLAAADAFPRAQHVTGIDLNAAYLRRLRQIVSRRQDNERFHVHCADVLRAESPFSWSQSPDPMLVIGNPPWVTNSGLGALRSTNAPAKSNVDGETGFAALTGRSNFDISEWILRMLVMSLNGRRATMAMLCKTSVARKVLAFTWKNTLQMTSARCYAIDAEQEFSAAVDACLFVCEFGAGSRCSHADVHCSLESEAIASQIGWRNGQLIADVQRFDKWNHLQADETPEQSIWRSGIKHDCAAVLELDEHDGKYRNQLGELADIDSPYLYPLIKSSDLAADRRIQPRRWLLLPHQRINEDPQDIAQHAPRTWQYLQQHAKRFDRRQSSIYRDRPPFSIFGVGEYSFSTWKVAISGFYKQLKFRAIGPYRRRPIVFDDTCYFLPCRNRIEAEQFSGALNSDVAREFYSSLIFWDSKRPITAKLLRQLHIQRLLEIHG